MDWIRKLWDEPDVSDEVDVGPFPDGESPIPDFLEDLDRSELERGMSDEGVEAGLGGLEALDEPDDEDEWPDANGEDDPDEDLPF